jgi:CheY-like chemotaxis protein
MRGDNAYCLFADDMEEVRTLFCAALQQHGYSVLAACDGLEALSLAREHREPFDLLITDVIMPTLGGARPLARAQGPPSGSQSVVYLWVPCG